jgi:hypothetical protein
MNTIKTYDQFILESVAALEFKEHKKRGGIFIAAYRKGEAPKTGLDMDKCVASAMYEITKAGTIVILFIETHEPGNNYGYSLMKHLAQKYGYENMPKGDLTPAGKRMREKLDKEFNAK